MIGSALHQPEVGREAHMERGRFTVRSLGPGLTLPLPSVPVLWCIDQGRHQVLLNEEKQGEQETKTHGTADGFEGQRVDLRHLKKALAGVIAELAHCNRGEERVLEL